MNVEPVPPGTLFARLLTDIMIPPRFSAAIRAQGYDVAEVRAFLKEIQQDDHAILTEATRQKRAVITCNYSDRSSNFCLIHEEWRAKKKVHYGIVLISQAQISNRLRRWEVRDRLLRFLNQRTGDELKNQIWWLPKV
jgi:hypothetical protein